MLGENRQKILRICRVYAWMPQDQEDLYQEALFQIWRALPSLKDKTFANTWMYRVTLNTAISFSRKKSSERHARQTAQEDLKEQLEEGGQIAAGQSARVDLLYDAISKLNEVEKAVITMFLDDLSYEQIGQVLNLAPSHVGVLLHRTKKKLSALMKEVPV